MKKFRGIVKWNGQHFFSGDWIEGFYAYKILDNKSVILVERTDTQRRASHFVEIEVVPETVGQFTGLKDKNGTEIYEGDVVQYQDNEGYSYLCHIEYREDIASFVIIEQAGGWDSIEMALEGEVIGNIYQHPELLNKSK